MELLYYWRIVKKRLLLIVAIMAAAGLGAFYYAQQQVPQYSTSTTLFLNPGVASPLLPYQTLASVQSLAETYVEYLRTRSFASLVAQKLDSPLSESAILGSLSAELVPDTQFFKIRTTHADPAVAQALANSAAEVLIAENISRRQAEQRQIEAQQDPGIELERRRLTELQAAIQEEVDFYADRIADLQDQVTLLEGRPGSEEIDQRILSLREELVNYRSLRAQMFGSLVQTQAGLANISEQRSSTLLNTAVVVDPAPLPTTPSSGHLLRTVLLALAAGLALGVGLAFLLEYVDWTLKTPEELDAIYGMSTLGVIGHIKNSSGGASGVETLVTVSDSRSPISEAYRALRTNIRFASPDRPARSLLVTSAGPVEGKTMTSANLAVILAQAGQRVILVDTDLRRPRQHRVFDVEREPGFTNLVVDQEVDVEDHLQPSGVENLRLLACGPLPRNPSELLGSDRAGEVMEVLLDHADYVIYDSPPVATVTDAAVLGARVDGVLHVVLAGGLRRDVVLRTKGILEKVGARVLGPILNQVKLSDLGYYSQYYYYGHYHDDDDHDREKQPALRRLLGRQRGRGAAGGEAEVETGAESRPPA